MFKRPPDFIIGEKDNPYLLRWYVIPRNPWFNIYLHQFLRDDDDRALHDHPWPSMSIILAGGYIEYTPNSPESEWVASYWKPGQIVFRKATHAHRIELYRRRPYKGYDLMSIPAWTLFITGPKIREWGFHCPKGWVHWEEFTAPGDYGKVGRGCGETN